MYKELFKQDSQGYIMPIDTDDSKLWKWCNKKNRALRKAYDLIEEAKLGYWTRVIRNDYGYYYYSTEKDNNLQEWCQCKNAEMREDQLVEIAIQQGLNYNNQGISEQESIANTDDLRQKVEEEYWKRESDRIDEIYKSRSISEEEAQRRVEEQRQREERRQLKRENIVLFMQTKKTTDDVVAENNDNLTDTI